MTACKRGDVVLVGFVFSDESGKKLRPALVISSPAYGRERKEIVVAAITSNIGRRLFGDHLITDWKRAGFLFPSVATGIIRTVARGIPLSLWEVAIPSGWGSWRVWRGQGGTSPG